MQDLKVPKTAKVKDNRRRKKREAIDWKKFFRRSLHIGMALGSLGLIVSGGLLLGRLLFASDYFRIADLRVENNARISREEVLGLSEIVPGVSIFQIDLNAVGRKIEENPWVAQAQVERVYPREVVIRIRERAPCAIVNLGYLYYVDAEGVVFKMLEPGDELDFPVLTGIERKFLLDQPEAAGKIMTEAMSVFDAVAGRSDFTLGDVSELHYDQIEGYVLTTMAGGVPIRLGFGSFAHKLDRLERIYPELKSRLATLKYIDLNVADRVIVRVNSRFTPGNS
ncbi:MAG: FtsQ-type POTRA domain-containing protein [Desulfuromonadales bacterium]